MTTADELRVQRTPLAPFGTLLTAEHDGADLRDIAPATLERWTIESKVVVLRGFPCSTGRTSSPTARPGARC